MKWFAEEMRRWLCLLPLLAACKKKEPAPAPERAPEVRKVEPKQGPDEPPVLHPESPLTLDELRTLGFPPSVRVVKESHLDTEHRFQVWAENHAVRLVLHWHDLPRGEPSVRYETRRAELERSGCEIAVEDRYGSKSYFAVRSRKNEEYEVTTWHVEAAFVKGGVFGYVMAGNLEQEIPRGDLERIVRRAMEALLKRIR